MNIKSYLVETDSRHSHIIDAYCYAFAAQEFKARGAYILMYIKKKPHYIPEFVYKWILGKLFVLSEFKK